MDLVIVSPLYRLTDANNIFKNVKVKIIALDCLKDYPQGLHTCNKENKKRIRKIFPTIDFNYLDSNADLMWSDTDSETIDELLRMT